MWETIVPAYISSVTGRVTHMNTSPVTAPLCVTSNSILATVNKVGKKKIYCQEIGCSRVFGRASNFRTHLKSHTGKNTSTIILTG